MGRFSLISVCTLLLLAVMTLRTSAQDPFFKSFEIKSEATKPEFLKILKDHSGMLWTGTDQGVYRFDGFEFIPVTMQDSVQYPGIPVTALFEDRNGIILAGYKNGRIARIVRGTGSWMTFPQGYPKSEISAFCEDEAGRLFITTLGEGVYFLDKNILFNINHDDGLSDDFCYTILRLPDGRLCTGTDRGLNFIRLRNEKKEIQTFTSQNGLPDNIVRSLALAPDGSMWAGMEDKGVCRFNLVRNQVDFIPAAPWNEGEVNTLLPLSHETWIGTQDHGILVCDTSGMMKPLLASSDLYYEGKISDLKKDAEQNVWIASGTRLTRSTGEKIRKIPDPPGLKLNEIHCLLADEAGNLWFSPDQQLYKASRGKDGKFSFKKFEIIHADNAADIVTLYKDDYGYLWIGTLGKGVFRLDTRTGAISKVLRDELFNNGSIMSISGKRNTVWIAGFNGITKCQIVPGEKGAIPSVVFLDAPELKPLEGNYIYSVLVDRKFRVWFATDDKGAAMLEGNSLRFFTTKDGLPSNNIHTITEDNQGRILFGTTDAGISIFDGRKYFNYSTKEGLSDRTPSSLLCDTEGNLVIVQNNGLNILQPDSGVTGFYSAESGVGELNPDPNSISNAPDGSVWFGSERGIFQYRPQFTVSALRPSIDLTGVSVFLERIDFQAKSSFGSDENNFRFDYSGLWYSDPAMVNYSYILEGLTTKWEETKDPSVTFPKLPPAKYTFRVKASLNHRFEHLPEATYSFEIHPPFWQRWWFRIAVSVALTGVVIIIVRRRENRFRKYGQLEKEKIEFQFETLRSQVNPHFLFNSFNTLITVIEENPGMAVEYVERLSEFFRNIITYRDKDLIPLKEELSLLDNYLFIQKKRYGDSLALHVDIPAAVLEKSSIAPLTLQLLAENAIKHNAVSRETPLRLELRVENGYLVVRNNINLKIKKEISTGLGLQNIINRYQLLTEKEVHIVAGNNIFTVGIPILTDKKT